MNGNGHLEGQLRGTDKNSGLLSLEPVEIKTSPKSWRRAAFGMALQTQRLFSLSKHVKLHCISSRMAESISKATNSVSVQPKKISGKTGLGALLMLGVEPHLPTPFYHFPSL